MITSFLLLPLMAMINRFAGGGMWLGEYWNPNREWKLPGRALYVAVILVFLASLIALSPNIAFLVAFTFGFWRTWAWGMFIGMGHHIPERTFTKLEEFLFWLSGKRYDLAFFFRNLFLLPGFLVIAWYVSSYIPVILGLALAVMFTLTYKYIWEVDKKTPIRNSEIITGILWGVAIIIISLI